MPFGFFEKSPTLSLSLDRPGGSYAPGDVIHAGLNLSCDGDAKINAARVALLLRQRYKVPVKQTDSTTNAVTWTDTWQEEETTIDQQQPLGAATIHNPQIVTADLHIPRDAMPIYVSDYIEVHWVVKATVDRSGPDVNQEQPVTLIAPPPGTRIQPGEYGNANDLSIAALRFDLPKLEFADGETLQGKLLMEPHQDLDTREIRLELVWQEHLTSGDQPADHETIDQKVSLAGPVKYGNGQGTNFPFSIMLSAKGHPTLQGAKAQARWLLRGTVDRAWAADAVIEQEIFLYNAAR